MDKNKIIFPSHLEQMQQKNIFKIYRSIDKNNDKNILFIGSCRTTPLAYYLHYLYSKYNIYLIYLPHWTPEKRLDFDYNTINSFLDKTDIIITENATNYDFLNTNKNCENNFFKNFQADHCNHIMIPNLELHMYTADIYFIYKHDNFDQYKEIFIESRERLAKSINSTQFNIMNEFIYNNLSKTKLFATFNHPTRLLSLLTLKILIDKLNFDKKAISLELLLELSKIQFLEGHNTGIVYNDIDLYGFEFLENDPLPNHMIYNQDLIRTTTNSNKITDLRPYLQLIMDI